MGQKKITQFVLFSEKKYLKLSIACAFPCPQNSTRNLNPTAATTKKRKMQNSQNALFLARNCKV
jgi:hypothetical protein